MPRLVRIVALVFLVWVLLGVVALILFHRDGVMPGRGTGDPIGLALTR